MEEKLLKEMIASLNEIKEQLSVHQFTHARGPVADPGPEFSHRGRYFEHPYINIGGPVADPGPWQLLDKEKLARIKIVQLERILEDAEKQIQLIKIERDLLKEEYKL